MAKITKPIILDETGQRQATALETLATKVGFIKGDKGDKGDTPVKGVDYFTTAEINTIEGEVKTQVLGEITIPTKVSELTNDSGYITSSAIPTNVSSFTNDSGYITSSAIPTNVSSFTNDSGYQTLTEVQAEIAKIAHFTVKFVDALPETGEKMTLYMVPKQDGNAGDVYNEYIWIESTNKFELIGNSAMDLSDYPKKGDLSDVAFSGSYNNLSDTPTIPTVNNATLTIQKNGTQVDTFTANASVDKTINITVPTNNNELTNGAGYITSSAVGNATITIKKNGTQVDTFTTNASTDKAIDITVPTKVSDLTNDSLFITTNDVGKATLTIQKNGTLVNTFGANATSDVTCNITVPTKVSDLTNDLTAETFTFVLEDGTTVTKQLYVK